MCLIGTYPPRECGIATFSYNLLASLRSIDTYTNETEIFVVALNDVESVFNYPEEVAFVINQDKEKDYIKAAEFINKSGADFCLLQHEYGIYGGENGMYILSLIRHLQIPFVTTLHTVLKNPSYLQKKIVQDISSKAFKMVVMSQLAVDFLKNTYHVAADKISLIEHGVPMVTTHADSTEKELAKFSDKKILFTFGLLSRNKGIETVIEALPAIVSKHPNIIYIVLGKTHPGVVRSVGEEYRDYLQQLANDLNVGNHLHFIKAFVTDEALFAYLKAIDIYITPYLNEAQITSGTLSYAIGAGAAVVSTPYWHAQELLADGRGKLFPFKDANALSQTLNELLDKPECLAFIRNNAAAYGERLKSTHIAAAYLQVANSAINNQLLMMSRFGCAEHRYSALPTMSLAHIRRMTDNTGIVQHAIYGIPNLKEGYCLDDNARALLMSLMHYSKFNDQEALDLIPVYLSYIHYMQKEDGQFRNFLHFNHTYLDEIGSEDSFGRTIWALGYLIRFAPDTSYHKIACELFRRAVPHFSQLHHLRGITNTIIGLTHYLANFIGDKNMQQLLVQLTDKLINAYTNTASANWHWFEKKMTYDNGLLPLSLLLSAEITGDAHVKKIGFESLAFLEQTTLSKGYLTPVGNQNWYEEGGIMPLFDQQAIEVMAMVLLYKQAYESTDNPLYLTSMQTCFEWFTGNNELSVPLYDDTSKGCCDGLQTMGVNHNQGAESTLAYLISHLSVLKTSNNKKVIKHHFLKDFSNKNKALAIGKLA